MICPLGEHLPCEGGGFHGITGGGRGGGGGGGRGRGGGGGDRGRGGGGGGGGAFLQFHEPPAALHCAAFARVLHISASRPRYCPPRFCKI